ncbi:hypothetical protein BG000_004075, partial [Podila horticola]
MPLELDRNDESEAGSGEYESESNSEEYESGSEEYYSDSEGSGSSSDDSDCNDNEKDSADEEEREHKWTRRERLLLRLGKELKEEAEAFKDRDDPQKSAAMWMKTIATEGGFGVSDKKGQYFAFSTSWQVDQAVAHGDALIFDHMRNIYGPNSHLYTLLVVHTGARKAVPVSYLLTKDPVIAFIASWATLFMSHVTKKRGVVYSPEVVFTKRSSIRFGIVESMFPDSRVLYCNTYVTNAITKRIWKSMDADPDEFSYYYSKVTARSTRNAKQATEEEHYFPEHKQERWLYAHRQDVSFSRVTSSDHSSSWRSSLKANLVTDCKQTREDLVIRSLARRTEATFGGDIRSNLESDYYGSSRRQDDARRVKSRAPSQSLVSAIDDETLCVKSFVSSSKYKIAIDPKEHSILSCSCPDFFTRGRECKHIALVKLERPTYRFGTKPASR